MSNQKTFNLFDVDEFFNQYAELRTDPGNCNELMEKPSMKNLIGDVKQKRVLDIGCGDGDLCRWAISQGATSAIGIDLSSKMIAAAIQKTPAENPIIYKAVAELGTSIEDFDGQGNPFDLVVSSLVLHWIPDLAPAISKIASWIAPGGAFVFSMEHPVATASKGIQPHWITDENGKALYYPMDAYYQEGPRIAPWFIDGVTSYHRTLSSIINMITGAGLLIEKIDEPLPIDSYKENPSYYKFLKRPLFLMVKARKISTDQ